MNRDDERRRMLRRLIWGAHRERQRRRRNLTTGLLLVLMVSMGFIAFPYTEVQATQVMSGCGLGFVWPIESKSSPMIVRDFDNPAQPWLPGHRGVDLQVSYGVVVVAPSDGTLVFAGQVGGKNVLTIDHGNGLSTTYEPATTTLPVGTALRRGEQFGKVDGHSDHCDGQCLHWGLREGKQRYRNPEHAVRQQRIALKPVDDASAIQ
ncbi:peptidase, M23 family [Bifidobacterium tissieri]|uniref:Peptidase, M23 family n=1 Tax=Bifidobacterium tissieri TaxID=1630162 RepID=A0A261FD96_9BIFI|nr:MULTISPECIES: M23 family metallopeptidase [Bifidobacterium]OZG57068.1 peptidase, M23 family [Bifidobacterium tissieri]TPF96794.1 hypothetical protein EP30_05090 [Bifidobacterium sp. UTCIF-39]